MKHRLSDRSTTSRALAAFVLVAIAARSVESQQLSKLGAHANSEIEIEIERALRANRETPPDTVAGYTKRYGAIAVALGVVYPGGGQLYSARYAKGAVLTGIVLGAVAFENGSRRGSTSTGALRYDSPLPLFALIAAWGYGVVSAPFDARRYNRTHSRQTASRP